MLNRIQQFIPVGQFQQAPTLPELPPGPSLDRVRGPVEIPFLETWQIILLVAFGIILIGLIGWYLIKYIRRKKNCCSQITPVEAATKELEYAASLTAGDDERFAVLTSMALRNYFEASKAVDALGKTTDEFLKSLDTGTLFDADARNILAEFLQQCDHVKFARSPLTQEERQKLTQNALQLIKECEKLAQAETNTSKTQS